MKTTVFWTLAPILVSILALQCGVIATQEDTPGDVPPKKFAPKRVRIPIKGVEFYARSIRLIGTKVMASGDLRVRLERFPRVEIRATRLEYRIGGDEVRLDEPTWTYPVGEETSRQLKVRAQSATFRIKEETVVATSIRVETEDGQISLAAERGTWRSKSRDCLLESLQGEVFTATDKAGRGSRERANFGVKIERAAVQLSPDLTLKEIRLERISGMERREGYVFEIDAGVLNSWPGRTLREARFTGVKIVGPPGHAIECDTLSYRPPPSRKKKGRTP